MNKGIDGEQLEIDWELSYKAQLKLQMEIDQKILQWYKMTKDEKYREFMSIEVAREGKIESDVDIVKCPWCGNMRSRDHYCIDYL